MSSKHGMRSVVGRQESGKEERASPKGPHEGERTKWKKEFGWTTIPGWSMRAEINSASELEETMKRILCGILFGAVVWLVGPAAAQTGKVEVLWLGQSAIKITTTAGKSIVIDPYLTKN